MAAGLCVWVLVLAVTVASFLFDLHAYLVARRAGLQQPHDAADPEQEQAPAVNDQPGEEPC